VINGDYLGRIRDPQFLGRTGTHEVGHWLGLYHTFQDGCLGSTSATCNNAGDRVCDTPQAREPNYKCPSLPNTCTDTPINHPDQIENYMDYSDGTCQNMFTLGQKTRMDIHMDNTRSRLWSAENLASTGCDGTVSPGCTPEAGFKAQNIATCEGVPVQFTDLSLHAPTSWSWTFPGGNPSTSTAQNPIVTYSTTGDYSVTLVATNSFGSTTTTKSQYIRVTQPSTSVLVQGFENTSPLPAGWLVTDDHGVETWRLTTTAASEGKKSMKVMNYQRRNSGETMLLHSNSFSLQNLVSGYLAFDHSYKRYPLVSAEKLEVLISTDCGSSWTVPWSNRASSLVSVPGFASSEEWVPTLASHWKSNTIPLDSFAGQPNVKVIWKFTSGGGQSIYLDNIKVEITVVSTKDANHPGWDFQVAPNPFQNEPKARYSLDKPEAIAFSLSDISGKVILTYQSGRQSPGTHELPSNAIEFRALPAGVYFLTGTSATNVVTKKLVKMD
jgi:PKD repeat protein